MVDRAVRPPTTSIPVTVLQGHLAALAARHGEGDPIVRAAMVEADSIASLIHNLEVAARAATPTARASASPSPAGSPRLTAGSSSSGPAPRAASTSSSADRSPIPVTFHPRRRRPAATSRAEAPRLRSPLSIPARELCAAPGVYPAMRGLTLFSLALLCCHPTSTSAPAAPPARDAAPATPAAPTSAEATPGDAPATASAPEPTAPATPPSEPAWALTSSAILLQYESQPTLAVGAATDPFSPYGRVAYFTMFRDGTILASKEDARGLFVWQIAPERAAAHLARVIELGFPKLRSHTSDCIGPPARRACVADASFQVLRASVSGGRLREIKNYAGWEPRHGKELEAIYKFVADLRAPDPAARLYIPHAATLFVRAPRDPSRADASFRARAIPWPLSDDLLGPPGAQELQVSVLDVPQIQAMTAAAGTNHIDEVWFIRGDRLVQASMIPWLPGEDHRPAIASRAKGP